MRGHGNDGDGSGDRSRSEPPRLLRGALREARIEAAERTGVVVDLRDAEIARLELLNDELDPVFAEIPAGVDLFDRGISRGDTPRLWIDAIAHIEMGRDKRLYRFVQDSRSGRQVVAESQVARDVVEAVTRYIARRLIERERALAGDELFAPPGRNSAKPPARRRGLLTFVFGILFALAGLLVAAWIAASVGPAP
jgi:hypothetical protein